MPFESCSFEQACKMLELEMFQIEKEVFFVELVKKESKMLKLKCRDYIDLEVTYVGKFMRKTKTCNHCIK